MDSKDGEATRSLSALRPGMGSEDTKGRKAIRKVEDIVGKRLPYHVDECFR